MEHEELLKRADYFCETFEWPSDLIRELAVALRVSEARRSNHAWQEAEQCKRAERAEAELLSVTSQRDHATNALAAWEQVWDGIRENRVPTLNERNKPLAVAASYELACRAGDEWKRKYEDAQALLRDLRERAQPYHGGGATGQMVGMEQYRIIVQGFTLGEIDALLGEEK